MTVPSKPSSGRDHPDVRQISDAIVQTGGDPRAFRFRDLADLAENRALGIFRREIERLLHDPRNRFAMAIRDREQAEIIAFAQERIGRRHETARDDRAAADG